MRFRVQSNQVIVEFADCGVSLAAISCSGGYLMTYPLLPIVSLTLSIEWHAVQASPRLGGGCVHILPNRSIHHTVQQDCGVVAPTAPFGRLDPIHILHIHN